MIYLISSQKQLPTAQASLRDEDKLGLDPAPAANPRFQLRTRPVQQ